MEVPLAITGTWEEPMGWAIAAPVGSQFLQEHWEKDRVTIFPALTLLDAQLIAIAFDITDFKPAGLAESQSGAIDSHEQRPILGIEPIPSEQSLDLLKAVNVGTL